MASENKIVKLVKDKHNWWLIDGRINIPIINNGLIEEQITYLSQLYEKLGYEVIVDYEFCNTY